MRKIFINISNGEYLKSRIMITLLFFEELVKDTIPTKHEQNKETDTQTQDSLDISLISKCLWKIVSNNFV